MKKNGNKKSKREIGEFKLLLLFNFIQTILIIVFGILFIWNLGNNSTNNKDKISDYTNSDEEKNMKDDNYVFLGDSITDWFPFSSFFSEDTPIINSGFAGYNTSALLNHDMNDTVYKYNPTKVFIQIGTNDIGTTDSSVKVAYNNIVKIVKNIKKNRPKAVIYLESIYPVNQVCDKTDKEATGDRDNTDIIELNKELQEYCKSNDIKYINVYDSLADDSGNLKTEYTIDGLHLSFDGYSKVSDILKKYIEE